MCQGKLPLLAGSKDAEQILRDIQMPDDQEIVGITERLVEQEPVISAATGSLNENPPETLMEEAQTLDKVEHCLQSCITQHMATLLLSHPQITFFIFFKYLVQNCVINS